jgi:cell division transport system permease protein
LNRIGYYLKEGILSVFTNSLMSFATICMIVSCLLLMGSFSLLAVNINKIIADLEAQNQVIAYVDETLTNEEAMALDDSLLAVGNVSSVQFITREQAMETFLKPYGDNSLFDDIDASVFRNRFIVSLDDVALTEATAKNLANVAGIAWVSAHLEISRGFVAVRNIATFVSIAIVALLFLVSMFIMSNTIKLTTFTRRNEIAIVKMMGASNSFIRWPFTVEGMFMGLIGSCIAFLLQWALYMLLADKVAASALSFLTIIPFGGISLYVLGVFVAVGLIVGVFGSRIAIRSYLRV